MLAGKPVVLMPFDRDQPMTAAMLVKKGLGLILDSKKMTPHTVAKTITTVLEDKKFASNATYFQRAMKHAAASRLPVEVLEALVDGVGPQPMPDDGGRLVTMSWWQVVGLGLVVGATAAVYAKRMK
eukprot:NODE_773_length_1461_cov_79.293909_g637_i0.p3 GENE.NODE_773_length_1461_cov_79.293909_g637_i0~~NODE_773_length_1461_cov_79.293909_g637_i0.p3  ORF type:complete len:126 (-),score=23.14 NODE_773_length_1461_cov_79.293909_g637_i0:106-483(-)